MYNIERAILTVSSLSVHYFNYFVDAIPGAAQQSSFRGKKAKTFLLPRSFDRYHTQTSLCGFALMIIDRWYFLSSLEERIDVMQCSKVSAIMKFHCKKKNFE